MFRNVLIASINTILVVGVFVVVYEWLRSEDYERWRSEYENAFKRHASLTVASSDPILLWEYRPMGESVHREYLAVTRTNEHGFRQNPGVHPSPPAGTRRIAFIGDSVTLGREVEFEQVFSQVAEAVLNSGSEGVRYEALNFGIDGYNTRQIQRQLMTKVFRYSPDLVIYALCLNDFDFKDASAQQIRYFKKPESFLLEDLGRAYRRLSANDYHTYHFNKNKKAVFEDIAAMQAAAGERGVDFLTVIVPVFQADRGDGRVFKLESFDDYHLRPVHDEIVRALRAKGVKTIDFLPSFSKSGLSPETFAYDLWHMNTKGHDLVGQAVAQLLIQSDTASPPVSP